MSSKKKIKKAVKTAPTEQDLLKALDELEKGAIPAQMKDADGGLATEGESLGVSADENAEKVVKKAKKASPPMEMSDDESSEDESEPDEESDDESEESMSKGEDSESVEKGDDDTSSSDRGAHETSSPDKEMTKSFKEVAEEDDTIAKAIEVSGFMEQLVALTSDSIDSLRKSVVELEAGNSQFNTRMRKAIVAIGNATMENRDLIKSLIEKLGGVPAPRREGKTLLSKSDIHDRSFTNDDSAGEGELDHTNPKHRQAVANWLFNKVTKGELDPTIVTMYESNTAALPLDLMKSCENDLFKSSS